MADWTRATVSALWEALDAEIPAAVALRREIHREPDASGHEERTAERVVGAIGAGEGRSAHGARLVRVGGDGPSVAIRAELDALPVDEETGAEWASTNGFAHVCGHDVHLAALVACTRAIAATGGPLPLLAVLQPREETIPSGAEDLVSHGVLDGEDVRAMVAVHVQPRIEGGTFSALPGAVNAGTGDFEVRLRAHGGHAGYPHTTGDPVVAAAALITALQTLVSRRIDPVNPAVVTVGSVHAGTAPNVIPDSAVLTGTIRAFDDHDRDLLIAEVSRMADAVASLHGCEAESMVERGEPPLVNHPELSRLVTQWVTDTTPLSPTDLRSCGADDFAFYGAISPITMVFYGVGDASHSSPGLHHPRFLPSDDDVVGVARCQLAAYLAGCELVLGPVKEDA